MFANNNLLFLSLQQPTKNKKITMKLIVGVIKTFYQTVKYFYDV